jgi:hypothetical protein
MDGNGECNRIEKNSIPKESEARQNCKILLDLFD